MTAINWDTCTVIDIVATTDIPSTHRRREAKSINRNGYWGAF